MAKVKINSLPEGFEIKDGKVIEKKAHGGITSDSNLRTGDQKDYGLVAFTGSSNMGDSSSDSTDVRYSLSSVPREEANLEAEGGETVLADLNQDGNFGLYDITGPRHSSGGVPMYLPDQSFIFSDTKSAKLDRSTLKEFGIDSKKKMTPAKVSKKFDLNKYYGAINDDYADEIQVKSAELMLEKNMKDLSKLSYIQEQNKDFRDGVALTNYPYLMSQGIDPIQFTAQVEEISEKKAMQEAFDQLPEQKKIEMMLMQEMQAQAEAQQAEDQGAAMEAQETLAQIGMAPQEPSMIPEQALPAEPQPGEFDDQVSVIDQARDGLEVYQDGDEKSDDDWADMLFDTVDTNLPEDEFNKKLDELDYIGDVLIYNVPKEDRAKIEKQLIDRLRSGGKGEIDNWFVNDLVDKYFGASDNQTPPKRTPKTPRPSDQVDIVRDQDFYRAIDEEFDPTFGSDVDPESLAGKRPRYQRAVRDDQGNIVGYGRDFSGEAAKKEFEGRFPWVKEIENWDFHDPNGEHWGKFQEMYEQKNWERAKKYGLTYEPWFKDKNLEAFKNNHNWSNEAAQYFVDRGIDYGSLYVSGDGFDHRLGYHTFSAPNLNPITQDEEIIDEIEKPDEIKDIKKIEAADVETSYTPPKAEWWLQDLIQLNAINNRKRKAFMPWQPDVEGIDLDFVLEDPTRAIAAINEQLGVQTQAAGMFGGPQSLAARTAQAQGKAATAIANEIGRVNTRNVQTINRGNAIQARYDALINRERRDRKVKQYDDTQKVLQMYMDERNFDNEQYAGALANAVTNRANTYNLNSIQDYYKINPRTGGKIGQFSQKAFQPADTTDPLDFVQDFGRIKEAFESTTGSAPSKEMMESLLGYYTALKPTMSPQETNLQREIRNNPYAIPFGTSMVYPTYNQGMATTGRYRSKNGMEVKKRKMAVPFYVGLMGR